LHLLLKAALPLSFTVAVASAFLRSKCALKLSLYRLKPSPAWIINRTLYEAFNHLSFVWDRTLVYFIPVYNFATVAE
jgi:hypothetical protein